MRDLGAVFDYEEPLPHPASDQVPVVLPDHQRSVGTMRRGHCTCKVEGHQEAALGARAVVKAGLILKFAFKSAR